MKHTITLLLFVLITSCARDVLDDYNDVSFRLTDQHGETYLFPDDFEGSTLLMGFIYTHCPDICTFITANMQNIYQELDNPEGIRFLIVTFDPERDTPDVLESYAEAFDMNQPPFHFLTGDPEEIEAMMERMAVRSQVSFTRETEAGDELYFLNHSDKMLLINSQGELIMEYGGSMTPVHIVLEDLNNL